jgi:hypothetical protein
MMNGNTDAALDQVNLAEIQLSFFEYGHPGNINKIKPNQWSLSQEALYQV